MRSKLLNSLLISLLFLVFSFAVAPSAIGSSSRPFVPGIISTTIVNTNSDSGGDVKKITKKIHSLASTLHPDFAWFPNPRTWGPGGGQSIIISAPKTTSLLQIINKVAELTCGGSFAGDQSSCWIRISQL